MRLTEEEMIKKRHNLPICVKCPMAILSRGLENENIVLCGTKMQGCIYQIGYIDPASFVVKLCGRRDLTYEDFV